MANTETWRSANLKQARSDLAVFDSIKGQPLCQQLHYLQMATEKLAKAYLSQVNGGARPNRSHQAFVRFLRLVRITPRFRTALNWRKEQFRAHVDWLLPTAQLVEDLAPAGDKDKPNPEYPWETAGAVIAPVDYPFAAYGLGQARMAGLIKLVRLCMNHAL